MDERMKDRKGIVWEVRERSRGRVFLVSVSGKVGKVGGVIGGMEVKMDGSRDTGMRELIEELHNTIVAVRQ